MPALQRFLASRPRWCLAWAGLGLYLYLAAHFLAPGLAALRMVFYLFLLLPFLLALPRWGLSRHSAGGWITGSALLFALFSAVSTAWGEPSSFGFYGKQVVFLAVWLLAVAWLFAHRPPNLARLYRVLIAVGTISAVVLLVWFYAGHGLDERLRGWGVLSNPTIVAQGYGLIALLAYVLALQARQWRGILVWLLLALVAALPVVLSQSRGAALALVLTAALALALVRPPGRVWLAQLVLGALAVLAAWAFTDLFDILRERGLSWSYRNDIWADLLRQSLAHPWLGTGWERESHISVGAGEFHHAHNSWLDIFYRTGAVGLALALWHLALLLRGFTRRAEVLPLYLWLVFGCLCLFTNGWGLLSRPDAQWLMYWIPAGLIGAHLASARAARADGRAPHER